MINASILRSTFERRAVVIGAVQGGIGVLLAARLGYLAIAENEKYRLESESNRVNLTLIPPRRGWILDRNGAPLASNRADFRVDIIPERLVDADATIDQLGAAAGARTVADRRHQGQGRQRRAAFSRSKSPAGSTTNNSPPSACACPICRASCRSAAFRASIRPRPASAT